MIAACDFRRWCGVALIALAWIAIRAGAGAAQEDGRLTVSVAVCPTGAGAADLARCEDRRAEAFQVSVLDAAMAPIAEDATPEAGGRATIDVAVEASGRLRVVVQTAVNVGTRSVACQADGVPVAAELRGAGAAIPVFQVDAARGAETTCVVYLYGFAGDTALLDIVPGDRAVRSAATPAVGTPFAATPVA